jgi:hypothetical protein
VSYDLSEIERIELLEQQNPLGMIVEEVRPNSKDW